MGRLGRTLEAKAPSRPIIHAVVWGHLRPPSVQQIKGLYGQLRQEATLAGLGPPLYQDQLVES